MPVLDANRLQISFNREVAATDNKLPAIAGEDFLCGPRLVRPLNAKRTNGEEVERTDFLI